MSSFWMRKADAASYPPLQGRADADVVVIGGGITGITLALRMHDAGRRVVLLEAADIGTSNTGNSTGNLYGTVSEGLTTLRKRWDDAVLRQVAGMRMQAVEQVGDTVARFGIDCGFARQPLHLGVSGQASTDQSDSLDEEFDALAVAGLAPAWLDTAPPPVPMRRGIRIERQAQFNPYAYTRGLASALAAAGVRLHERSPVLEVDAGDGCVRTAHGEVRAASIVFATHTPKGFNLVQAEMEVYREYGIAAPVAAGTVPDGIFWVRDSGLSLRGTADGHHLVVVGQKHKTGHPPAKSDPHRSMLEAVTAPFGTDSISHQWSAQQYRSADGLPYAGVSAHDNVYIAAGFGADGLTWGTVAATLIAGLVQGQESEASELLAPRRFTPTRSAKRWAAENVMVLRHLIGDRLSDAERETLGGVEAGTGRIVELDDRKFAVHRDHDGRLTVVSPVCPHLKCHVAWNGVDGSWDCPCHGSRFTVDGDVIEGPALEPLVRYEMGDSPHRG